MNLIPELVKEPVGLFLGGGSSHVGAHRCALVVGPPEAARASLGIAAISVPFKSSFTGLKMNCYDKFIIVRSVTSLTPLVRLLVSGW